MAGVPEKRVWSIVRYASFATERKEQSFSLRKFAVRASAVLTLVMSVRQVCSDTEIPTAHIHVHLYVLLPLTQFYLQRWINFSNSATSLMRFLYFWLIFFNYRFCIGLDSLQLECIEEKRKNRLHDHNHEAIRLINIIAITSYTIVYTK